MYKKSLLYIHVSSLHLVFTRLVTYNPYGATTIYIQTRDLISITPLLLLSIYTQQVSHLSLESALLHLYHLENAFSSYYRRRVGGRCSNFSYPLKLNFPSSCLIHSCRIVYTGSEGLSPSSCKISSFQTCCDSSKYRI